MTFRHLFHIQSASLFADQNMADYEGNQRYVTSNRRYVSTFANKSFKIRLDQAMPLDPDTKSPYYYKDAEGEYKRVRGYEIMTYYLENPDNTDLIYNESNYKLTGVTDDGIATLKNHSIENNGERMFGPDDQPFMHLDSYVETTVAASKWIRDNKEFARSIMCSKANAKKGKYFVRIYGKDLDGNIIRLKDDNGDDWPLVVAEYEVEFLDDTRASFVPEEDIPAINANPNHKYYSHMERYLERRYGESSDMKAVNFDQYTILKSDAVDINGTTVNFKDYGFFEDKTWGDRASRLKLPIRWSDSNYGFGYTTMGDYNMFRLADHSALTPYKGAAELRQDNPVDAEFGTTQKGTYDRLFYNTGGKEKGLFYYVNAASDPGEMVRIDFDYLCPGSTIYVSAWVNEFNQGQPETANVIFNFYGNVGKKSSSGGNNSNTRADDSSSSGSTSNEKDKIIRTEQLHGFATGYVKRNPEDDYENGGNTGGDQGKWMHVYYSFVPDKSHADLANDEDIISYSLVLENNCVSSAGADYAIDDIRAYVVAPRVEAEQVGALCEKSDTNIDIEVQLPLDALKQAVIGLEDRNDKDVVKLQYSIVDKTRYDDKLDEIKGEKTNYEFTTDDHYAAFAAGVLHYPHDNNESNDAEVKKKPLSWGTYDFYPNYEKQKNVYITVGTENISVYNYMLQHIREIDGEKYFTFITHPVANGDEVHNDFDKIHRTYFVLVDNLGVNTIFKDLPATDYSDGKTNADVYPAETDKSNWVTYDKELAKAYQLCTSCARMSEFTLKSAAQIVVDGVLHENGDNITCCENQRPVIQLNLKTRQEDGNGNVLSSDYDVVDGEAASENPYLDWWTGPFEDFAEASKTIDGETKYLWDVLDAFRTVYPDADTWDMPEGEKEGYSYTNDMRNWLKELCATTKVNESGETVPVEPKLILHQSSYVFPQSKTSLAEDGKKLDWKDIYVTAIPPRTPTEIVKDGTTYVICTQPREVKITVSNTSPKLFNGFDEIDYPTDIEDVPLRIGLKQLDQTYGNRLYVPLRDINPATFDVTCFQTVQAKTDADGTQVKGADPMVYLVETNDPNYRKLSDHKKPEGTDEKADVYDVDTRIAGQIERLTVLFNNDGKGNISPTSTPMVQVKFNTDPGTSGNGAIGSGITFREGYYYKFKFNFEEAESKSMTDAGYEEKCNGQTVFTIKVVPEYQVWTGGASLNWNNDENWRRVDSKTDLLGDGADKVYDQGGKTRYTTDGDNENTHSYAPMNFTKVIIPAGSIYPQLAPLAHSYSYNQDPSKGKIRVSNGKLLDPDNPYTWIATAPDAIPVDNMTVADKYNVGDHKEATNTQPTLYINYDMAAVVYTEHGLNDNNVYCRPWYANACEQIHFDSNAEILNQQYLDYEKAWVDMEMTPHRWYNVASPLYGVVAGDMYLPSVGTATPGRQMTELFTPINYDKAKNDRFAPAVYQRGWDKGTETVYNIDTKYCPETETVALASTWSHVYNDVAEEYAPGMGYSVKTDVTRLDGFQDEAAGDVKQTLVKFRFPKADMSYSYFKDGSSTEKNYKDLSPIKEGKDKEGKEGKLFEMSGVKQTVTLKKANSGNLFLVGNPFMAHLDMAKFIEKNSGVIEPKYWLLSEGEGQTGVVMVHDKEGSMLTNETLKSGDVTATSSNTDQLAPMQGFFVQAKGDKTTELIIKFTPDMMAVQAYTDHTGAPILKAPRPETRADGEDIIRVSTEESTAIIRLSGSADKGYAASEDVEMIDDSNQRGICRIYTVAGTIASAINQTPDADGVEIGLMAPTDSVTVVTFNGLALEDYMLYDTATGEKTQLYDGFELEMTGSVSGRYYLTNGVDTVEIEDNSISIMPVGREVVVKAPAVCGELTVCVFDTLGREVAKAEGFAQEVRIALEPGIYAVEATGSDAGHKTAKLSLR